MGRPDNTDLDRVPGVPALRGLALAWWRAPLGPASFRRLRFEYCITAGVCIDSGNAHSVAEVARVLVARERVLPPQLPAPGDIIVEDAIRAAELSRQTLTSSAGGHAGDEVPQYVTLDKLAAIVNKKKKTLDRPRRPGPRGGDGGVDGRA